MVENCSSVLYCTRIIIFMVDIYSGLQFWYVDITLLRILFFELVITHDFFSNNNKWPTLVMMIGLTKISKKYIIPAILMYIALFLLLHNIFISFPWPVGSGIVSVWFPYYNPFIFALYFIMGISIGWIITYFQNIQKTIIADIVFLCSVGCIGIFLWFIRWVPDLAYSYPISPYRFPLVPILWVFAIVSIIYSRYIWLWIDNRILLWLATVSYSLYLWHGLIISIILQIFSFQISTSFIDWSIFSILSLVISFWFAALSARYIESIKRK